MGIAASPGIAHGNIFIFLQKTMEIPIYAIDPIKSESEIKRFEEALMRTRAQIAKIRTEVARKLSEEEALIFDAHILVLEDRALFDETIRTHQESKYNIDYCFQSVVNRYIDAFNKIDDEYIRERAADIRDVSKRVLENLLGETQVNIAHFCESKIIVSTDLSPTETANLKKGLVLGIATDGGGRTSHAVIIARSLRIPAVVGLGDLTEQIQTDDILLIDGFEGIVYINPSTETLRQYELLQKERRAAQSIFDDARSLPSQTLDGSRHNILLNIDGTEDVEDLKKLSSDGIGLFRSEALFLKQETFPSEEDQFNYYIRIVKAFPNKPVIIRTLDIGGDKKRNNFFHLNEQNPFLGYRAIRFCLQHKDLFKEQLRAILRVSAFGQVKIMYPMISSAEELIEANKLLEEAKKELVHEKIAFNSQIPVGIMIETPSIAITLDLIKDHCSFVSIGTNDLIQYILAVDRLNERIASLYDPNHPAIVRILNYIVDECKKYKLEISVCGEMAGDVLYAPMLLGLGVHNLSLHPGAFSEIKYLTRNAYMKELQVLANDVIRLTESAQIGKKLKDYYHDKFHSILKNNNI